MVFCFAEYRGIERSGKCCAFSRRASLCPQRRSFLPGGQNRESRAESAAVRADPARARRRSLCDLHEICTLSKTRSFRTRAGSHPELPVFSLRLLSFSAPGGDRSRSPHGSPKQKPSFWRTCDKAGAPSLLLYSKICDITNKSIISVRTIAVSVC